MDVPVDSVVVALVEVLAPRVMVVVLVVVVALVLVLVV